MTSSQNRENISQDNFIEAKDPAELMMCLLLSAAYAGLAKYCWLPLLTAKHWNLFICIEGFCITTALLAFVVGLRPYISPSSLQVSTKGMKYKGPYWPQRKTVNWDQIFRLYVSPELIVVLYHPKNAGKMIWPMFIQSIYLSDKDRAAESVIKYSQLPVIRLASPNWATRLLLIVFFIAIVIWVLNSLLGNAPTYPVT